LRFTGTTGLNKYKCSLYYGRTRFGRVSRIDATSRRLPKAPAAPVQGLLDQEEK
ncbi:hypothetical protein JG688_00018327, partial [Phytophthora aleatoria]